MFQGKTIDELIAIVSLAEHRAKQRTKSQGGEIEESASKELHVLEDRFLLGAA